MSDSTYVAYFVPGDGDNEDAPNLFVVRKAASSVTLADVKQVRCVQLFR